MNNLTSITDSKSEFIKIAKSVRWEEEMQFAVQALQKNEKLNECAPFTIKNSIINVAAIGLTLNPADGYCYLVPEYNKNTKNYECYLRVSYKGLIKLATDSGVIKWVKAEIVKKNDTFIFNGINEMPTHKMEPFGDRGDTIGAYCVAKTADDYLTDLMNLEDIIKIRACAKFDTVWKSWTDEMIKKAIIKRASKQWPQSSSDSRLNEAIRVINESEGIEQEKIIKSTAEEIINGISLCNTEEELKKKFIELKKLDAVKESDLALFAKRKEEILSNE